MPFDETAVATAAVVGVAKPVATVFEVIVNAGNAPPFHDLIASKVTSLLPNEGSVPTVSVKTPSALTVADGSVPALQLEILVAVFGSFSNEGNEPSSHPLALPTLSVVAEIPVIAFVVELTLTPVNAVTAVP